VADGLFFVALLGVAVVVSVASRRLALPYTVALVVVGLALGAVHPAIAPPLTRETLYAVFLPGLSYETALHLDRRALFANARTIGLLALPGVTATVGLTAAALWLAAPLVGVQGLRLVDAVLFGAIIAATDPLAVVAVFRALGAPERLLTIEEGESLVNDCVVVVLFAMAVEATAGGAMTPGGAVVEVLRVLVVGALTGAGVGAVTWGIARARPDAVGRAALTTVAAYGSFVLAERLHASGIVATLVAGLMTARSVPGEAGSVERRAVEACWGYVGFALNSLVFLLVGFQAVQLGDLAALWRPIVLAYVVVMASRAVVVAVVGGLVRRSCERLPRAWGSVLAWSGMRGALSMVLAIDLPDSLPERRLLLALTCGVVVLSILVQGSTMTRLLRRTGLVGSARAHEPAKERSLPRPSS
jgi:CPA1 family monovalent cation:H+ antiporter